MMDQATLQAAVSRHLETTLGTDQEAPDVVLLRRALCLAVRDQVMATWRAAREEARQGRQVAYLSMEFLIGRLLHDAVASLGLGEAAGAVTRAFGFELSEVFADEPDAALGNGGLGRLAACFLDSMATVGCPATGYGIRYEHGLFRQGIRQDQQTESPETWLLGGSPWEIRRHELRYEIGFGGRVTGGVWQPGETLLAQAYDVPVIGWQGRFANTLRLWKFEAAEPFDLARFNGGDHLGAGAEEEAARALNRVLYPDDGHDAGQALRLRQEYGLVAASLADLARQARAVGPLAEVLPRQLAVQMNDTHPALAGPELVRLLMDEERLDFATAFAVARKVLNYTNHTLLPEALERWPEGLVARLLPRHAQIIAMIDAAEGGIVEHGQVSMGDLAFVMSGRVNGVSALHSELVKTRLFAARHGRDPDRIVNQTNGVTPRRWLAGCNPGLARLITETIGDGWVLDTERLRELEPDLGETGFLERFDAVKRANKVAMAARIEALTGVVADPDMMFDVQIKRIHEYKRQHLNILETIALWQEIRDEPGGTWTPRLKIFAGKAAPGYRFAKEIIHLIGKVANVVNADPVTSKWLKVVFLPNYNVSLAEALIPAADLSEQISTAGKEASGTGNMKFALNGAPTIGTLDGANVEIRAHVGAENFFLFGMTASEAEARLARPHHAAEAVREDPRLARALGALRDGTFCPEWPDLFAGIADVIQGDDHYLVAADFTDYARARAETGRVFADRAAWLRMAALNTARTGWFSSDRTIRGYMADIWNVSPVPLRAGTRGAAA